MTLKRRGFLGMLGAALTVPAFPMAAPALRANVFALAAAHARKYPFVSVIGLSKRIGVPIPEAEKLLHELARSGLVGDVQSCATGAIHGASKVFKPTPDSLIKVAQAQAHRTALRAKAAHLAKAEVAHMQVDLSAMMAHLRKLAARYFADQDGGGQGAAA